MAVIALVNLKSSPGTTTAALALAHVWPSDREVLLIEADPAGGDIAARTGMLPDPGLASLAAAGRREVTSDLISAHVQSVSGIPVVLNSPHAAASRAAVDAVGRQLFQTLSDQQRDALVDCGRFDPASAATLFLTAADLVIIVIRPTASELARVAATANCGFADRACLLLVEGPQTGDLAVYSGSEVGDAVGIPVVATFPHDPGGASILWGAAGGAKALERSALVRSARSCASVILDRLGRPAPESSRLAGGDLSFPLLRRASQAVR